MSRTVILQPRAEEDILNALDHIPDPLVASRWFSRIMAYLDRLASSAEWYGLADEADELGIELRETFFGKKSARYQIVYVIRDDTVQVLTIRRSSRDRLSADDL